MEKVFTDIRSIKQPDEVELKPAEEEDPDAPLYDIHKMDTDFSENKNVSFLRHLYKEVKKDNRRTHKVAYKKHEKMTAKNEEDMDLFPPFTRGRTLKRLPDPKSKGGKTRRNRKRRTGRRYRKK
jgi:hypothetical protein